MRNAPPVNAELPQAASCGAISSISTEAPLSRADKAAHVAAFPAPTTIMSVWGTSRSAISILHPRFRTTPAKAGPMVVQGLRLAELIHRSKIALAGFDPAIHVYFPV